MDLLLKVESAYLGLAGTIAAAAIAALGAVLLHFRSVGQSIRDRKRDVCAKAISDALAWMEMPYRIRRRCDDEAKTLAALVGRMHDLQERLSFHENWIRIELPQAHAKYCALIQAVRDAAREPLREAWGSPPAESPTQMNLNLEPMPSVDAYAQAFADEVRNVI